MDALNLRFPYEYLYERNKSSTLSTPCDSPLKKIEFGLLPLKRDGLLTIKILQRESARKIEENLPWKILLIDKSSSVQSLWQPLMHEVEGLVEMSGKDSAKTLLMFYDSEVNWFSVEPGSSKKLSSTLSSMRPGGGTHLELALKTLLEVLEKYEFPPSHVILVSDGRPTLGSVDPDTFRNLAYSLGRSGATIDVLAWSQESNETLLSEISTASGGSVFSLENRELWQVFKEILGPHEFPRIRGLELRVSFLGDDPVDRAWDFPGTERSPLFWSLKRTWMQDVVEWKLPLRTLDIPEIDFELTFTDILEGNVKSCANRVKFSIH